MPALSEAEFVAKYGMTPREYAITKAVPVPRPNPQRVATPTATPPIVTQVTTPEPITVPTPSPVAAPVVDEPTVAIRTHNERTATPENTPRTLMGSMLSAPAAVLAAGADAVGLDTFANTMRGAADDTRLATDRLSTNLSAGMLSIPAGVPALWGIVGAGSKAAYNAVTGTAPPMDALFAPGGQNVIQEDLERTIAAYRQARPTATPNELNAFINEYQDSDHFYETVIGQLRPGLSMAAKISTWANEAAGMERRPDQQTSLDDLEQIIGGALVGMPPSIVQGIARKLGGTIVGNILATRTGRIAARTVEAATPITIPLTPTNAAINVGVGTGINEVVREITGQPTFLDKFTDPEEVPASMDYKLANNEDGFDVGAEEESASLGVFGAIFGAFGLANGRYRSIRPYTPAGPTIAEQVANDPNILKPGLGHNGGPSLTDIENVTNSTAPVLNATKAARGTEVMDDVEAELGTRTGISGENGVNNAVRYGNLEGLNYKPVPIPTLRQAVGSLSPDDQELFRDYLVARQAMDDRVGMLYDRRTELTTKQIELIAAQTSGAHGATINSIQKRITELTGEVAELVGDTVNSRPHMERLDNSALQQIIAAGNANPRIVELSRLYRTWTEALIDYRLKNGEIDLDEANKLLTARGMYVPLIEDPAAKLTGIKRAGTILRNRLFKKLDPKVWGDEQSGYNPGMRRNLEVGNRIKVNNPINALDALQEVVEQTVRSVQRNKVRTSVIDKLMHPNSLWKGKHIDQYVHPTTGQKQFTEKQISNADSGLQAILNDPKNIAVKRQGKVEIYKFGDQILRNALMFAPAATVPVMNMLRKNVQAGLTGIRAPWFPPIAAGWETMTGMIMRRPGTSFGYVDSLLRRMVREGSWQERLLDVGSVLDVTAVAQVAAAIPRAMIWRSVAAMGRAIQRDLAAQSGIFHTLNQTPMGARFLRQMSANMVRAFDQSAFGVMQRETIGASGFLQDPYNTRMSYDKAIFDIDNGKPPINVPGARHVSGAVMAGLKQSLQAYSALMESIGGAAKYAHFAQNYHRLKRNAGGGPPPRIKLQRLVNDTRQLSGDLSRVGGSKRYNQVASTMPYMNVIVQSMRHIFRELGKNPMTVGPRIFLGAAVPTLITNYMMSNWDEKSAHYWWNEIPAWKRMSTWMFPSPRVILGWLQGETVPFSPDEVYEIRAAPEFIPFTQAITAAANAMGMGVVKGNEVPYELMEQLRAGLGTVTNLMLPPVFQAGLAMAGQTGNIGNMVAGQGLVSDKREPTFSGANEDQMNVRSDISRITNDVMTAIFGTSATIANQFLDGLGTNGAEDDEAFSESLSRAFDYGIKEISSRMPDVPGLWQVDEKMYKYTPVAERVYDTMQVLEPVLDQRIIERDSQGRQPQAEGAGLLPIPELDDPMLFEMVQETHRRFKAGRWLRLQGELSDLNALLTAAEGSKVRLSADQMHAARNVVVHQYQLVQEEQNAMIDDYIVSMTQRYGDQFQTQYGEEWSPSNMAAAVKLDLQN